MAAEQFRFVPQRPESEIATLSGEVDRKSDAEILTRLTKELDGVVAVVDQLRYRRDDSDIEPVPSVSLQRNFRAI